MRKVGREMIIQMTSIVSEKELSNSYITAVTIS